MRSHQGLRVLVVEDEAMLSLALQDMLTDLGCAIVGTAARLDKAIDLARDAPCDVAVLDLNLAGARADPVADVLTERGIPFVFATGYGESGVGERHKGTPFLEKPYDVDGLRRVLENVIASREK